MRRALPSTLITVLALALPAASLTVGCRSSGVSASDVEAISLLGAELVRVDPPADRRHELEADLADALAEWERNRSSEQAAVWVGRRLAYLGRYRESIEWYTKRLEEFPESYRLLRHRGHRFISVREFQAAYDDLALAALYSRGTRAEVEPDGAPNQYGIPRSTTQSNIWYHLGLSAYLMGEFEHAAALYVEFLQRYEPSDDTLVATTHWLYMSLRRSGHHDAAKRVLEPITASMEVIENFGYYDLLKLYKGWLQPEDVLGRAGDGVVSATVAYGVANWSFCNGNRERAIELWRGIVAGSSWNAFGSIAAEADLARLESGGN